MKKLLRDLQLLASDLELNISDKINVNNVKDKESIKKPLSHKEFQILSLIINSKKNLQNFIISIIKSSIEKALIFIVIYYLKWLLWGSNRKNIWNWVINRKLSNLSLKKENILQYARLYQCRK